MTVSVSASDANDAAATIQTQCALDPALTPMSFGDLPSTKCVYLGSGAAVSADGSHTVYIASQDAAGNTESALQTASFKLDQTAPTITAVPTTTPNANGWYNSNVNVHFTCSDTLSGIPTRACPADQWLTGEGSAVSSAPQTVTDAAGNTSARANVVTVSIDRTPPQVMITGVANNAIYTLGAVPTAGCSASDALSGVATLAALQITGGTSNGTGSSPLCAVARKTVREILPARV
ncbi:MAG: hypothetical protein JOZ65_18810 [Chloroflexi bacterium]|nr:hypothetical protein [Chloroflexota bacterium]